jgi:hypothetical protein
LLRSWSKRRIVQSYSLASLYDREVYKPRIFGRERFIPHPPNIVHPTLTTALAFLALLYTQTLRSTSMASFNDNTSFYPDFLSAEGFYDIYSSVSKASTAEEVHDALITHWSEPGQPDPVVGSLASLPAPANHGKSHDHPLVDWCLTLDSQSIWLRAIRTCPGLTGTVSHHPPTKTGGCRKLNPNSPAS